MIGVSGHKSGRYFVGDVSVVLDTETGKESDAFSFFGIYTEKYPSGNTLLVAEVKDSQYVGFYTEYADSSSKIVLCDGRYSGGLRTGKWCYYHDNGMIKECGSYKDGSRVGVWTNYDSDGLLYSVVLYTNPPSDDTLVCLVYQGTTDIWRLYCCVNGVINGSFIERYRCGRLMLLSTYINGVEEGVIYRFSCDDFTELHIMKSGVHIDTITVSEMTSQEIESCMSCVKYAETRMVLILKKMIELCS